MPRPDRDIPDVEKRVLRAFPVLVKLYRLGQFLVWDLMNYRMIRRNRSVRRLFQAKSRSFLHEQASDPELHAKLTPNYEIVCKRVLITNDFCPALGKLNVELVASGVREGSIVAEDGSEHKVGIIIFATGFQTTGSPILSRIQGRSGRLIEDV